MAYIEPNEFVTKMVDAGDAVLFYGFRTFNRQYVSVSILHDYGR